MISADLAVKGANVIVLGMTFKENCPDVRNSKVIDVVRELKSFGVNVFIHDPVADSGECEHEYGVCLTKWADLPKANAIVAAVSHKEYTAMGVPRVVERLVRGGVFADVKSAYSSEQIEETGARLWRL
jgi:UDP-N-acetyl-D-galactosamine dehydrogenase